jgi:hypothetical protein
MSERAPDDPQSRVLAPVSSATGGVMPGIDLDDSAGIQDLDDRERRT